MIAFQSNFDPATEEESIGSYRGEDQAAGRECWGSWGANVRKLNLPLSVGWLVQSDDFWTSFYYFSHLNYRRKEKQDIEDLEIPATKKVFLEQNKYKKQKSKEEKEYLDALNKEVKGPNCTKCYHF